MVGSMGHRCECLDRLVVLVTCVSVTGWLVGLTTEPQHKSAGADSAASVNEGVHSKITNLK